MAMSMSLDSLSSEERDAAPPSACGRSTNKYLAKNDSESEVFSGRSFTLDEDGLVHFLCSSRLGVRKEGSSGMDDHDKRIYNSLGDTSGPRGKMTYSQLDLDRAVEKRGIMFKSGPSPSWCTRWKKRLFVLKGNFLYYLPADKKLRDAPVLGAIYLKHSIVEKMSLPFAKRVLSITPPVPRRRGWKNDESCVFYIRFRTHQGQDEWFEELQQVSFDHKFPAKQEPTITNSLKIRYEAPRSSSSSSSASSYSSSSRTKNKAKKRRNSHF